MAGMIERHSPQGPRFARRALQVAENDPRVLANAVFVLGRYGEDPDTMIALVDRALALNPSYARGWFVSGSPEDLDWSIRYCDRAFGEVDALEPESPPVRPYK